MTYEPLTATGRANVQGILDLLEKVGNATGSWTEKVNARQTGVTYYATFEKKVDVMTALEWANQDDGPRCVRVVRDGEG